MEALRRFISLTLIFSMLWADLAVAGRHGTGETGYNSDGESTLPPKRSTPPKQLRRYGSSPDLTVYFGNGGKSSVSTSPMDTSSSSPLFVSPENGVKTGSPPLGRKKEKKRRDSSSSSEDEMFPLEKKRDLLNGGSYVPPEELQDEDFSGKLPPPKSSHAMSHIPSGANGLSINGEPSRLSDVLTLQSLGEDYQREKPQRKKSEPHLKKERRSSSEGEGVLVVPRSGLPVHKPENHENGMGSSGFTEISPLLLSTHPRNSENGMSLDRFPEGRVMIVGSGGEGLALVESRRKPFFPKSPVLLLRGKKPSLLAFLLPRQSSSSEEDIPHFQRGCSKESLLFDDERQLSSPLLRREGTSLEEDLLLSHTQVRMNPHQLEEGMVVQPEALLRLLKSLENIPPSGKAVLVRTTQQELEGKISKSHVVAVLLGGFIGVGLAVAMGPVYDGGLVYMRDVHNWTWIDIMDSPDAVNPFESPAFDFVVVTTLLDAIPRNVSTLKQAFSYVREEAVPKLKVFFTALSIVPASLVEPAYLIIFELYAMNKANVHGFNNQFAIATMILAPFLFLDSMMSNFITAWEFQDDIKQWAQTTTSCLTRCVPRSWLPSFEMPLAAQFKAHFTKLAHFLKWCPEERIEEMHGEVFSAKQTIASQLTELEGEELDFATGFFVNRYLLSIGSELEEGTKRAKSWYETLSDVFIYGALALGSPYRMLVLELVVETIFGLFLPQIGSKIAGWLIATLGFPIQTALEYKGLKGISNEILWEESPSGHSSHSNVRKGIKAGAFLQAAIFLLPLFVFAYQATDIWFGNDLWMIMSIPFLLGEFGTLATQFNGTNNQKVGTAITKTVHKATCCGRCANNRLCTPCKRDQLIRFVHKRRKKISTLPPIVLDKLNQTLHLDEELYE